MNCQVPLSWWAIARPLLTPTARTLCGTALIATAVACSAASDEAERSALGSDAAAALTSANIPSAEGMIDVPGGRVWYRRIGSGTGVPLLALHGGPGGLSCRFEILAPLGNDRPVIFYDQLGSGRSDHPADTSLWRLERFVAELAAVRNALSLDTVHLLGHSWGGALAAEYMVRDQPTGVRSLVLSSPLLSTPIWLEDAAALRAQLPASLQKTLDRHEGDGTIGAPEYAAATDSFYARHVRRLPVPNEPRCDGLASNDTVYRQMWGPTEFRSTGSLRSWDRAKDLSSLTLPVLFLAGEFDEARPETLERFRASMSRAKLVVIPGAAHAAMREKPTEYISALRAFLSSADSAAR